MSCAEGDTGHVYAGLLDVEVVDVALDRMPPSPTKIMMNVGNPELAFEFRQLPERGRGPRAARVHHQQERRHPSEGADRARPAAAGAAARDPRAHRRLREPDRVLRRQDRRGRRDDRRRVLAEEGDRPAVRLQVERVLEPRRRPALRAARGEPDARISRRVALHRARVPRLLRARMRGDEACPRRHGIHQRRADDPVRAHAGRGRRVSSRC